MSKRLFIFLIIFLLIFGFLFFSLRKAEKVEAGSGDNVYGWAWSDKIGWISFNNTTGGGAINYGVHICESDSDPNPDCQALAVPRTGRLVGYAWSRGTTADVGGIGWIRFDPVGPYPEAPNYSACLDLPGAGQACDGIGDYNIGGWARAYRAIAPEGQTLGGWEGWIKLRGVYGGGAGTYGIKLNQTTKEFEGWAWGGDPDGDSEAIIGWISFNGLNTGSPIDYKVKTSLNFPPYIEAVQLDGDPKYCRVLPKVGQVNFKWTYKDDDGDWQSQYHLQVATDLGFTDLIVDSYQSQSISPGGTGTSAVLIVPDRSTYSKCLSGGDYEGRCIEYGNPYYWRVQVQAATGSPNWSGWGGGNFTTDSHPWPWIDFSLDPQSPSADELVQFCSIIEKVCIGGANNGLACALDSDCPDGSCVTICPTDLTLCYDSAGNTTPCANWSWSFPTDWQFETGYSSSSQNPLGKFTSAGLGKSVELKVTDSDGLSCTDSRFVGATLPLPEWKEVPPAF